MKIISFLSLVTTTPTLVSSGMLIQSEPRSDPDIASDAFIIEFQDGFDYAKPSISRDARAGLSLDVRHQYSVLLTRILLRLDPTNGGA
ncbi:hypothetical protein B0O80DRAFT_497026 [Mortierella sp. GBAus27b]|nr:hypothetical protein B0O80DRAFT_497026 [Mortierella sp. GBAus27b]